MRVIFRAGNRYARMWRASEYNTHACIQTGIHTYIHTCIHSFIHTSMHEYIHTDRQTEIRTHIRTYLLTYLITYIHACVHTYIHYITLTTLLHYINYITLHYMTDIITVDDRHSYSVHSCTHTYVYIYIYILAYIPTCLPTDRPTYLPTYWGELGQPAKNAIFAGFTIPAPMCCSSGNSELHFCSHRGSICRSHGFEEIAKSQGYDPEIEVFTSLLGP